MIELVVSHDRNHWIARGEGLIAEATTLAKLDDELKEQLRERGRLAPGENEQPAGALRHTFPHIYPRQAFVL